MSKITYYKELADSIVNEALNCNNKTRFSNCIRSNNRTPYLSGLSYLLSNNEDYDDFTDEDGNLNLEFEMPGVEKKNITINIDENNMVDIKADRYKNEKIIKTFSNYFYLGDKFNKDTITAKCNNGILNIIIEPSERKKKNENITVNVE